jgi:hypothetical protein
MEDVDDNKDDDDFAHVRVTSLLNPIWNRNKDLKIEVNIYQVN